jgi:hypothetical protein
VVRSAVDAVVALALVVRDADGDFAAAGVAVAVIGGIKDVANPALPGAFFEPVVSGPYSVPQGRGRMYQRLTTSCRN